MKKVYYKLLMKQTSPLRIANTISEETDSDLLLDGRGLPFIPGTSIAGIIRHMAEDGNVYSRDVLDNLFGMIDDEERISSAIIIGDAVLPIEVMPNDRMISRRDGVALDDWSKSIRGSKYDFQIAEAEELYTSIIEWNGEEEQYKSQIEGIIDPIMKKIASEGLKAGAKISRGFGLFDVEIYKKIFEFPQDLDTWLEFSPFRDFDRDFDRDLDKDFEKIEGVSEKSDNIIEVYFRMKSSFSVKEVTARTELEEDGSLPDSVPMTNYKNNPVIPGTSWAGTFRHHMHSLIRDIGGDDSSEEMNCIDESFGVIKNVKNKKRSSIHFSETEINLTDKNIQKISVTRTSIDRLTSGPCNTALFTDMVCSGGTGVLKITFKKNDLSEEFLELLAACLCDLHLGLISVGGSSSVGRGIMEVTSLKYNGTDVFDRLKASIEEGESLDWLKEEQANG